MKILGNTELGDLYRPFQGWAPCLPGVTLLDRPPHLLAKVCQHHRPIPVAKDRGEVSAQGPGTFELYAGLGVEREKEVKSGSRKNPSPYIVESSQGLVLGEANSNELRDLWRGLPPAPLLPSQG